MAVFGSHILAFAREELVWQLMRILALLRVHLRSEDIMVSRLRIAGDVAVSSYLRYTAEQSRPTFSARSAYRYPAGCEAARVENGATGRCPTSVVDFLPFRPQIAHMLGERCEDRMI
jgi:hypothetical protein